MGNTPNTVQPLIKSNRVLSLSHLPQEVAEKITESDKFSTCYESTVGSFSSRGQIVRLPSCMDEEFPNGSECKVTPLSPPMQLTSAQPVDSIQVTTSVGATINTVKVMFTNATFEGTFEQIEAGFNANGLLTFDSGDKYKGQLLNGRYTESGTYTYASGAMYMGQFLNGSFDGYGHLKRENGDWYKGYFKDNVFEGRGEYRWKDGTLYKGVFSNGVRNGLGELKYNDGSTYFGDFQNDQRSGKGLLKNAKGSTYEGEFLEDKRHGRGTITAVNGCIMKGRFVNDHFDGTFVLRFGKRIFEVQFENGEEVFREEV